MSRAINTKTLNAVAQALSNDRYAPYRISTPDRARIENIIKDEFLNDPDAHDAVHNALLIFQEPYSAIPQETASKANRRNLEQLNALIAFADAQPAAIYGKVGSAVVEETLRAVQAFDGIIGVRGAEDGPSTKIEHVYEPKLAGAAPRKFVEAFGPLSSRRGNTVHIEEGDDPFAVDRFLELTDLERDDLDGSPAPTFGDLKDLAQRPGVQRVIFAGTWISDSDFYGESGGASLNLFYELGEGHFIRFHTEGGWQ